MPAQYCNAPLCTIDVASLKSSRFLLEASRQLCYRDAEGAINVNLCKRSQQTLATLLKAGEAVSDDVQKMLARWAKHAETWAKTAPAWERREAADGGFEWVAASGGAVRRELDEARYAPPKGAPAPPLQREGTDQAASRHQSRVGENDRSRGSRGALEALAAQRSGKGGAAAPRKRAADDGRAADGEEKRARAADDAAAAEAKERAAAEAAAAKAARREAKEAEAARRKEAKAAKKAKKEAEAEDDEEEDDDDEAAEAEAAAAAFDQTMEKCDQVATSMRETLAPLVSASGDKDTSDVGMAPPSCMPEEARRRLAAHQRIGLAWLHSLHTHDCAGILADEMGLGKTAQAISLLARLLDDGDAGPHIVVAPVSTLENWTREIALWCPALTCVKYHGSEAERDEIRQAVKENGTPHVVVCSFTTFSSSGASAPLDQKFLRKLDASYLIIDEAQKIKNANSITFKNLSQLKTRRRLLLTGTPIENKPLELLTLLSFLMPKTFDVGGDKDDYKDEGGKKRKRGHNKAAALVQTFADLERAGAGADGEDGAATARRARRIRKLMAPFVLRRLKSEVLGSLPPKTEETLRIALPASQKALYAATVRRIAAQARARHGAEMEKLGEAAGDGEAVDAFTGDGAKFIQHAFSELRKVANHPLLVRARYDGELLAKIANNLLHEGEFGQDATYEMVHEELKNSSDLQISMYCSAYRTLHEHALPPERLYDSAKTRHLAKLLPQLLGDGHRILMFSQWTSVLDYLGMLLEHLGISFVRFDGSTSTAARQEAMDAFNSDDSIGVFLLTTRAGGLGINLTTADTVITHDADFNPAADKQAMDRCHRMGQTRPVRVIKLASAATVDEKVLQVANGKRRQQERLLGSDSTSKKEEDAAAAAAEADDSKDLMGGILRALLRSHEEGGGEEAEDEAEAAEGADANTTFVAAAEEEAEEAAEAALALAATYEKRQFTEVAAEAAAKKEAADAPMEDDEPAEAEAMEEEEDDEEEPEAAAPTMTVMEAAEAAAAADDDDDADDDDYAADEEEEAAAEAADEEEEAAAEAAEEADSSEEEEEEESLEAKVTKRVQQQAAHYKASAATLRTVLDGLSAELGSDVRAAGLKLHVKTVLVHALDALADE